MQRYSKSLMNLVGKTVTLSCIVDGELHFATATVPSTAGTFLTVPFTSGRFEMWNASDNGDVNGAQFYFDTSSRTLLAAKLELGDTQTLAHKENGVWVLNEIPDYGEQLARCQRCAIEENYHTTVGQLNYDGDKYYISVQFPCEMRTSPVITLKEISAIGWGSLPISGAEVTWNDKFGFFVSIVDLTNMNNFIGKSCYVKYFASADL